jgi:UDP-N-acetylmuramyl pentapeptide phosphotransferase/UDP-N-acetylglucosamine-1-phosphate transferase
MNIVLFFLILSLGLILSHVSIKKKLFLNLRGDVHQKFVSSESVPLLGGIILILTSFFYIDLSNFGFIFFISFIFCIGLLSDIKKINSPKLRLFFQILTVYSCVQFSSIVIPPTNILLLDYLLGNLSFQIAFTVFCILVLINGYNFIDGVNTSLIGYCLIISSSLYYLELNGVQISQILDLNSLISVLVAIFILNFFNKLYLGDSGSYLLGLLFAICLIDTYQINDSMSSLFIISILWYPAFENLFSILRKIKFSISPINPDTNHLHQLIFFHLKKIFSSNSFYANTLTGLLINLYNLLSIMLATQFYNNTQVQILIIIFNIFFYVFIYLRLKNQKSI